MRSSWLAGGLLLAVAAASWGGWTWSRLRRDREGLAEATRDVAEGRYAPARRLLAELADRRPGWDEVYYQLGLCEEARGQSGAALEAWSRIPDGSPMARMTAAARARVLSGRGRFAEAEAILLPIRDGHDEAAVRARSLLEFLYRIQGRRREIRELILDTWPGSPDPAALLRLLFQLDEAPFPVDYVRRALEGGDPKDDRVWLGRANLATWLGHRDEARRWLDACLAARPEDPAVWSARLDFARLVDDAEEVRRALGHLPAAWLDRAERLRLRVWLAARLGDDDLERRELLACVDEVPGEAAALDRLAELAMKAGRRDEVETYRRRKAEVGARRERYAALGKQANRDERAGELASLAEALGRRVEARGWRLIAEGRAASGDLRDAADAPGLTTADGLVADLLSRMPATPSRSAGEPAGGAGPPPPVFADRAESAGLPFFHDNGHTEKNPPPPEAMCGGVALLDYDGDGWLDVYAVQAGRFDPSRAAIPCGDRLFRNTGGGRFEDVTRRAGIAAFPGGYGNGVTVGDYDNDGRPDLFVTRWGSYALYRNRGDGTFADVTTEAGLGGDRDWPTSSAFADLDGDGDLDLYVCHYLRYDPSDPRRCVHPDSPSDRSCNPIDFPSLPDHVFRNDGGRFVDVTAEAGIVDNDGRGLGVLAADLDGDDRIDLFVANDMTANAFYRNLGGFRFEEVGTSAGVACAADGKFRAGMGIACGDLDGDGRIDLAVTNYYGESTTFYRNMGGGLFADHTAAIGLAVPSRPLLGFGAAFFDADDDGWLDLITANGHIVDHRPRFPWTMPLQLMRGGPGGRLTDVSDRAGDPFLPPHLGRGLAVGDLDHDGRPDAVVVAQNEPLVYLHNETTGAGHFIVLQLRGTRSNRDAVGARVAVECGGRERVAYRFGGGSYQSASDPRLHFGLGAARRVDAVEVRWPSGRVDRFGPMAADSAYLLVEGESSARPLAGWTSPDQSRR